MKTKPEILKIFTEVCENYKNNNVCIQLHNSDNKLKFLVNYDICIDISKIKKIRYIISDSNNLHIFANNFELSIFNDGRLLIEL